MRALHFLLASVTLAAATLVLGASALAQVTSIYVVERVSGELSVIDANSLAITTLTSGLQDPLDVKVQPDGNLLVAERNANRLTVIDPSNGAILQQTNPGFSPSDLFFDSDGSTYVSANGAGLHVQPPGAPNFTLFSNVPGDLAQMVRVGAFFYVVSHTAGSIYRVDPSDTDPNTNYTLVIGGFSGPLGLAVLGNDLLIAELSLSQVQRVSGFGVGETPVASLLAGGLPGASHFSPDGEGGHFLSHQTSSGRISRVSASGTVTTFISDTPLLANPRGLALSISSVTEPCPVSWWPGEGNALDIQDGNDGTLVGGVAFAPGVVGQGFSLDGIDDRVEVPDSPSLRPQTLTLEAWVRVDGVALYQCIFCKPVGGGSENSFALWVQGGALFYGVANGHYFNSGAPVPTGQFVHAAMTWDGSTARAYLDGVLVGTSYVGPTALVYDSQPMLLGADLNSGSLAIPLEGIIDEPAIYNRALTDAEIQGIYLAGSGGKQTCEDCNENGIADSGELDTDGDGIIDDCDPLAVELEYFVGRNLTRGPVYLGWGTASEIENVGFNVYREPWSAQASGTPALGSSPLNASLVPATGSPFQGARYRFFDGEALLGQAYSYWLEDVDIHGVSTFHGPIVVR